ncbi:NB-ARC domain-containing protein [Leptothoe sp. PORK10 BA2]|uniref:NB-ARC domain-containing protein n=1 Tax=Leptothoe sp. PORK10 BA2 TaxID=3110254 RepID=UPI002B20EA97|nr:NB-ARC domain-containing protein [Leptothoe sp. PORK10 BA2]MEA5467049.1 NB-ARC domain-containing protein [Leptothoe sp. PORK10 BA2]
MARYALVIGISEYKNLKNLSKPVGDAEAIAALLRTYGGCEQVKVLKGGVSAEQLESALTTLITEQAVRNEVVIYFTGHGFATQGLGGKKGHLATSDCEIEIEAGQLKRQSKAIAFSELNDLIRTSNLSNLVMFLDACHSGEFIESALVEQSFSAFSAHQDYWLIAACRGFEEAWAKKSEEHSVFTGALLEALSPKNADPDGCITGDLLVDYLRRALKGSRQELVRYGKGRSLPIVRFPLPEQTPESSSSPTTLDTTDRVVRSSTIPLQMPPLPDHFVERPDQQQRVKADLLCEGTKAGTLVVSAIYGLGGIGKSVLAAKLARDADIQSHFSDGILWATLGQNPDILPLLSGWIQALGDNDYKPTAKESASNHLRTLLYDKRVLLVVDDVWNPEHLEPFRVGGEGSCVLVTTREARISGAHLHQLGVMSPEQSLELMTQKISEPLSDSARQQALSFAERVGHLPLALELAASQIEDGVTWQELVEDFQSEIVRLETLDVYGQTEMPDEEKRRKYSLLACFNLSLKQLSLEQLRQFAWLGVVPEDVSLTQEMAETLWQVNGRQAGSILRIFKSKSLVLQGAKQADERPSYRMHDLMHDLAQQLLRSSPQPLGEGELPGLGLTKAEAHSQLLEHYRKKTQKGRWHTLKDDGYIYAYLTWHMEQAKQPESIDQLLQASNEEGRNGWYEACDAIGKPVGFVNDLGRAWTQAVADYGQSPSQTLTRLFRYALMRASLNSLASNVPAPLVGALVEKGIWQPAQGLAYAQQAQDPWQRAECIAAIVLYMPKSLLPEVIKTIGQIKDAVYRSYVLSKLAERFAEVWPDVLIAIQQIQDRYGRHRDQTQGFSYRGLALRRIAQHLPSSYLDPALNITRQIQDESDRAMALIALSERLPELLSEALSVTREIKDEYSRASALRELAKHLPELLPEALSVTREIKSEYSRASALRALAKHLPEELLPEALSVTREITKESSRGSALSELAQHLPEELWPEALSVTREIKDESYRASTLRELAQHLPEELWPEALSVTREIKAESARASALRALAQHLPE